MTDASVEQQQADNQIGIYLRSWVLLFVLSAVSYFIDYFQIQPLPLRWTLIVLLAIIKASMILTVFMHLRWERLSLIYTILLPPILLLALLAILMAEGNYVMQLRLLFGVS